MDTTASNAVIVLQRGEERLSVQDRRMLMNLRNRKLYYFIIIPYLTLLLIVAVAIMDALSGGTIIMRRGRPVEPEKVISILPFVIPFSFILITFFFYRYFRQTAYLYIKDLKGDKKATIEFPCTKYDMGAFNRYYLKTPLDSKPLIELSREAYSKLNDQSTLVFEYAPHSSTILGLKSGHEQLEYF